ncbi:hypothetical protein [Methanococcus voltae]|uniref:Uncharacterized protein n=1 Tax=Methanococcus voltae (strain ATCC BAA-1334 / A3) TaxID=456320 RepID=D7DT94_METV3|nr:hypothetical protein [Methanococcus voltae]MCS3901204.1 hypothetical protein [Methanococcus voltae]
MKNLNEAQIHGYITSGLDLTIRARTPNGQIVSFEVMPNGTTAKYLGNIIEIPKKLVDMKTLKEVLEVLKAHAIVLNSSNSKVHFIQLDKSKNSQLCEGGECVVSVIPPLEEDMGQIMLERAGINNSNSTCVIQIGRGEMTPKVEEILQRSCVIQVGSENQQTQNNRLDTDSIFSSCGIQVGREEMTPKVEEILQRSCVIQVGSENQQTQNNKREFAKFCPTLITETTFGPYENKGACSCLLSMPYPCAVDFKKEQEEELAKNKGSCTCLASMPYCPIVH